MLPPDATEEPNPGSQVNIADVVEQDPLQKELHKSRILKKSFRGSIQD
jgi:hypothetical protein